jgi:hypothetical protein
MVEAILKGTKTQTRRIKRLETINNNPNWWRFDGYDKDLDVFFFEALSHQLEPLDQYNDVKCPYGKVGDVLWVRETFCLTQPGHPETYHFGYKAYNPLQPYSPDAASEKYDYSTPDVWKPSIHMPKEACRIFLEITDVRVERLNDISEDNAKAEGIEEIHPAPYLIRYKDYMSNELIEYPESSFMSLWESINGKGSWDLNPFVWVVEFKQIDKPNE